MTSVSCVEDDEHIAADWGEEGEGECSERVEVIEKPPARYVPPHLQEGTEGERRSKVLERLRKRVQGLVNRLCVSVHEFVRICVIKSGLVCLRLSESNMKSISTELEQLYFENSRNGECGHYCFCLCCSPLPPTFSVPTNKT